MATWHWVLADTDGTERADMVRARDRSLRLRVKGDSRTSFTLSGLDTHAAEIADGLDRDVKVYRDAELLFRGRLSAPDDDVGETEHTVSAEAVDYRAVLSRRILMAQQSFTTTEQEAIAWGLVDHTQTQTDGDLGITREGTATGVTRTRTFDAGAEVAGSINELGQAADGFDWAVTPAHEFRVWSPERGSETGALVYGGNVASVRRRLDTSTFATSHRVTADGLTTETRHTQVGAVGRWDRQVGTRIDNQTELASFADGINAEEAVLLPTWEATMRPGRWPDGFWLGDTVQLVVVSGRLDVSTLVRVLELTVDVDASDVPTVTVGLGRSSPDLADEFAAMRRRLTDLER